MSEFALTGQRPDPLDYVADNLRQAQVKDIIAKSVWKRAQGNDACVLYNVLLDSGRSQLYQAKTEKPNLCLCLV